MIKDGTVIAGRYIIVRKIGEGGMGEVYEAKHLHIERRVALKVLNRELIQNIEALERFQQEAKIAGTLGHLNICEVLDFGKTDDGQPFMVMEYLEGKSLADILNEEGRLPIFKALEFGAQILDALEEVHNKGIIHRDLKPENIFIANIKGHGEVVKILDFGISKIQRKGESATKLTKTGTMMGTPYYMSPEQLRGKVAIDHRTDIYSCSVMLYEMITGGLPYGGEGYSQIVTSIIEDPFPDPSKIIQHIPAEVVELLRWGMEKDRERRPESAKEFKNRIIEVMNILRRSGIHTLVFPAPAEAKKEIFYGRTLLSSQTPDSKKAKGLEKEKKRGIGYLSAIGIVVALVFAITGVVLKIYSSGRKRLNEEKRNVAIVKDSKSVKVPAFNSTIKGEMAKVKIEFNNTPPGFTILYNGTETKADFIYIQKGEEPVLLEIKADGYEGRQIQIVPSKDSVISGEMVPLKEVVSQKEKEKKGSGGKKLSGGKTGAEKGMGKTSFEIEMGEKEEKGKKKGLEHVWDYP